MQYPGCIIKVGEQDASIVQALKKRLNEVLGIERDPELRLDPNDPSFGPKDEANCRALPGSVRYSRSAATLENTGEVGSLTWAALFGNDTVPNKRRRE